MKNKIIIPLMLLLFTAAGCSTAYNLTYADYDKSIDLRGSKHFHGFRTRIMIILLITTRLFLIMPSIIFRMNWQQEV